MPTTPSLPPPQCCDTRARVPPRERDVAERERERERESCMGNGKKIRRRRSAGKIGDPRWRKYFPSRKRESSK